MPPRFYCSPLPDLAPEWSDAAGGELAAGGGQGSRGGCVLGPEESRHARKVLRLGVGDAVELFDGSGRIAEATLTDVKGERVACRVHAVRRAEVSGPWLAVASAVPKGPRAVEMVNQLAQLGVDAWWPLACDRSVVDPRRSGAQSVARYERAALAAAKQSGRATLLQVGGARTLAEALAEPADRRVLLHIETADAGEGAGGDALEFTAAERVVLLVGPEGGWTDAEVDTARAAGAVSWRIAEAVLRIETAAAAGAALARYLGRSRLEAS